MKFVLLFMAIIWLTVGEVHAEKLILRSGDHPTFSRLTIPVSASQKWEGRQTTSGVELELFGFSDGFELESVFLRMRRNRISNMRTSKSTLTLEVTCDCVATVFRSGPLLVIDVADNGSPLFGPQLQGPPLGQSATVNQPKEHTKNAHRTLPWIGGNSPFGGFLASNETSSQSVSASKPNIALENKTALLKQIQNDLVEAVAGAASAGLLESRYQTPAPFSDQDHSNPTALETQVLPETLSTSTRNMRITSSMDHAFGVPNTRSSESASGIQCPKVNFLSIEAWGEDTGFSAQVGPARTALMNARDQLDDDAAQHLARLYLYFGFGAEALDVLSLIPSEKQKSIELTAIAEIFEYGVATSPNLLGGFIECPSNVALWASLSFEEIPRDAHVDTSAALRALNKLPKHLRQIVAPALSERFLKFGDAPAAAAAMRSIERLSEPLQPEAIMAQANLVEEAGNSAETLFEDVLQTNTTNSPEALVKIVEGQLAKDEPLSYETATLVEAYVQELRGTPIGRKLQQTQIIALSQTQRFDEALVALDQLGPSISPDTSTGLRATVLKQLTKQANDLVFLEHVFAQKEQDLQKIETQTKLLIASRLMGLGFAAQVQELLSSIPETPRTGARQLLAARAALGLHQPFQAQAALIGFDEPAAALLLAQAKEMTGAYSEASEIFASNSAPEQAVKAAWLSKDLQSSALQDTSAFGAISMLAQEERPVDDAALGPLGLANRALTESSAARETLQQLLSEPIVRVTPDS